jgi:hypothetical protein
LIFWRNISPPSFEPKGKPSKKPTGLLPDSASFLLGLFFDPEDAGGKFLQNVRLSLDYMALKSTRPYSS